MIKKMIGIGILALLLLIPTLFVLAITSEREGLRSDAITDIASKWGGKQAVTPLIISIPVKQNKINIEPQDNTKNKQPSPRTIYVHIIPDSLSVSANVIPEVRHRSIYDAVVYSGKVRVKGEFGPVFIKNFHLNVSAQDLQWDKAFVSIGLTDVQGIDGPIKLRWNGVTQEINPGLLTTDVIESGVHSFPPIAEGKTYTFELELGLKGSQHLYIVPAAKLSNITIHSPWRSPSFQGRFLPYKHSITKQGFIAYWKTINLNLGFPQAWLGTQQDMSKIASGVDFSVGVDEYRKITRSVKYAILIIFATFFTFLVTEFLTRRRFHPLQYVLVGLMISLFYFLLLSISEYLSFDISYWISFLLIASVISGYTLAIFKSLKLSGIILGMLITAYSFVYALFLLENYALLVGSLGLFIILTAVMYFTRKIDWYGLDTK